LATWRRPCASCWCTRSMRREFGRGEPRSPRCCVSLPTSQRLCVLLRKHCDDTSLGVSTSHASAHHVGGPAARPRAARQLRSGRLCSRHPLPLLPPCRPAGPTGVPSWRAAPL
jgi:hypothetical protein